MTERRRNPEPPVIAGAPPPHDLDAEAACLSSMMLKAAAIDEVRAELDAEDPAGDFYSEANGRICAAIFTVADRGTAVDLVTVAGELRDRDQLAQIGGPKYLAELIDATPAVAHVRDHARRVREKKALRLVIDASHDVGARLYRAGPEEARDEIARALARLEAPITRNVDSTRSSLGSALRSGLASMVAKQAITRDAPSQMLGVSLGIGTVDAETGGLHAAELVFVSGPTGNGKSSLVAQAALSVVGQSYVYRAEGATEDTVEPYGVAIFTMEMTREEYALKMACGFGRVSFDALRKGKATGEDWRRVWQAQSELDAVPIEIDDQVALTPSEIMRRVRRIRKEMAARGVRLRLVVIDYLQLLAPDEKPARGQNEEQTINQLGLALRRISLMPETRGETWVALSQENEAGKLARSSALAQHAVVWLAVKVDKDASEWGSPSGRMPAKIKIKKQRFGAWPLEVPVWFEGVFARFTDTALDGGVAVSSSKPANDATSREPQGGFAWNAYPDEDVPL